jgi:phospholipid/cholesterol/gamma-HCH transport system ATP-binding protein
VRDLAPLPLIEFKQVVKSFGSKTVLKGISFQVFPGEIVFFLGRSGTGKSVLLKNLVGLMRPEQGEILYAGQKLNDLTDADWPAVRRKVGLVFQQPALFDSLTVLGNLSFGLKRLTQLNDEEIKTVIRDILALLGLPQDILWLYPHQLSYGQQKRVSIARTIVLKPQVLLFDEPTTGLDPVSTTIVNELILRLSRVLKTSSIVVSHDMRCALDIADRVIFLEQGQVLFDGNTEELKRCDIPLIQDFLSEVSI